MSGELVRETHLTSEDGLSYTETCSSCQECTLIALFTDVDGIIFVSEPVQVSGLHLLGALYRSDVL